MKKDIKNIKASVRARLQNKAKEENRPFSEVLQYYGMERFLYRVSQSKYADKFVLKGALMFMVWHMPERRTTLDIDFLSQYDNKIDSIEKMIRDICKINVVSDGLIFDSKNVKGQRIKENVDYEGVRVKFVGLLERSRIPMQIDIAFGDSIYPKPKMIEYPVILDFPKPKLKGYPAESIISEKFESVIKLGLLNSRMKDFYDIWLMMRQFDFNGSRLVGALKRTFKQRKTAFPQGKPLFAEEIYDDKSDRLPLWKAFLKKAEIKFAPKKLSVTAKAIEKFLFKPLVAINKDEKFNAKWKAPGPWA
ncbi:MAG: nucleotidyl transferase AbiEii/AbiGii toxin family protein [Candidatus Aminicenantes bacterium]|nr:nucleotidyl transferase AbiEii/AbiGii toxin family protein [Candidatus Aminicenantes bacterium]